jgi:hypothetical protein
MSSPTEDAALLAREFCRQFATGTVTQIDHRDKLLVDPATMTSWFATAIEYGRKSAGQDEVRASVKVKPTLGLCEYEMPSHKQGPNCRNWRPLGSADV